MRWKRRQLNLSDRCTAVLLESGDGLELSVFEYFEIFLPQTGNGVSFVVGDNDVDKNEAGLGLQDGGGVAGGWGRSL